MANRHKKRNEGKIIISTHCDIIWKAARIKLLRKKRQKAYRGNLDNLICVAEVLRSVMPRVKDRQTKFYFTTAEETTMGGALAVMHREGKALYIAIDVTASSKKADLSVEWMHNVNKKKVREVLGSIPRLNVGFRSGHHDETLVYGVKYPTFSLNLPLTGKVHGKSKVSFYKTRRFGRAVAEMIKLIRKNYDEICEFKKKEGLVKITPHVE